MSQVLEQIGQAIADATEKVGPAVVGLGRGWGRGSGVVVGPETVLTNAHVLRGEEVAVRIGGGDESAHGKVVGIDADLDLAVVRVDTGGAEPIRWEPEALDSVRVGTPIFALADPGGRGLRVTAGFVTATNRSFRGPGGRRIRGSVEHSAPLPRGASGGPLVDLEGRLLGLNAVRLEGGLILAVPADAALRRRVDALTRGDAVERPGSASRSPHRARRGACGRRSDSPSATGCSSAASTRTRPPGARASSAATCSWRRTARRSIASTPCSTRSRRRPAARSR